MTTISRLLVVGAAFAAATTLVNAEEGSSDITSPENCRAEPRDPSEGGTSTAPQSDQGSTDSLTDTLEPCDGVLKPPRTGDEEMTAPAPSEGRTPFIRPGDIPDQQPPAE